MVIKVTLVIGHFVRGLAFAGFDLNSAVPRAS